MINVVFDMIRSVFAVYYSPPQFKGVEAFWTENGPDYS